MNTVHHSYNVTLNWTGDRGTGTSSYTAYSRDHELTAGHAPVILGTADPAFRGDPARWTPEQLQVAALSQCHMLWYLHLAAKQGIVVTAYEDHARGTMTQDSTGAGQFDSVTLRPHVTITADSSREAALRVHSDVPSLCFIARSVSFPVHHEPVIAVECEAR